MADENHTNHYRSVGKHTRIEFEITAIREHTRAQNNALELYSVLESQPFSFAQLKMVNHYLELALSTQGKDEEELNRMPT